MLINNWKIFDKKGSQINWQPSPYIPLQFTSVQGVGAAGFLLTDPSTFVISAEITSGGHYYTAQDTVSYDYFFANAPVTLTPSDVSILLTDVSIYDPEPNNTKSISGLTVSIDSSFIYPSVTYAAAIFLEPVSQKLIETEQLYIFEQNSNDQYIRPYDASNSFLIFKFVDDGDNEIQFFTLNENTAEITWTSELVFDTSLSAIDTPIILNIGFKAEEEGTYERILRVYHQVGNTMYALADILVNAEAIGEDERFRTHLSNFGLPDPKDFPTLFKEADINEDMPDWEILNAKSKHMVLEHDQIMPYIGTYKALINAIKWLGYDDIYIREWFKNVKENKKLSLLIPYNATDRTQTILSFSSDQRKVLKKLNQLSLFYCLTRETGEIDEWGTPETENCYSYNLTEIYVKLLALKQWLEKNIIGVNCRIIDITGEGVYFERFRNLVYTTDNIGYNYSVSNELTPYSPDESSELIYGDASIRLTFLELTERIIKDLPYSFWDFAEYACYIYDTSICLSLDDPSYLADPSSYIIKGSVISYPFPNLSDVQWKLSVEKDHGVVGRTMVTNPLFIHENDIRFYNIYDTSSTFYDVCTNLYILLENAYLRDPSIDEWTNSISYSIYPDPSYDGTYIIESSLGQKYSTNGYFTLDPEANGILQYAYDDNYKVPLLSFVNYSYIDSSNITRTFNSKKYYLDILDGKIAMNAGLVPCASSLDTHYVYINWNYDTSLEEQMITMNVEYYSPRIRLAQVDVSTYYWSDPSGLTGGGGSVMTFDNSIYIMHVNHIGDYNIELFAWDSYNTLFYNTAKKTYPVWIKYPTIYALIDNCCNVTCVSTYISREDVSILVYNNRYPIYDRNIPLQGLKVLTDSNGDPYIYVPSITYFQDVPEPNSINRFYNMTERVLSILDTSIVIDADYQKFYANDDIKLVKVDKGKYSLIYESSSHIKAVNGTTLALDQISPNITIDSSSEVYLLNDTYRLISNARNTSTNLVIDISGYSFNAGQMVGIIVTNASMSGYSWGSSYRVSSVDGSTHTMDALLPRFFLNDTRYTIYAKHAFSTYTYFTIPTYTATETSNTFSIYLKDSYCQEHYLDDTFVITNILFDQETVNDHWYDSSSNILHDAEFYYHKNYISVDISTLIILRAMYDTDLYTSSKYMLNQKNIWTVINNDTSTIVFKVYNNDVPYIFNASDYYRISVESYDEYGNLSIEQNSIIYIE